MTVWGVGLGLLAAAIAVVAFVRYRERENASLTRSAGLARELRALAADDEVRLAAVDEFEQTIYQRLFYASVVGPWVRSAAWALLGTVLAGAAALTIGPLDGAVATALYIAAIGLVVVFGVATLAFVGIALFHTATTPRVSFRDSYADDEPVENPPVAKPAVESEPEPEPGDTDSDDNDTSEPESESKPDTTAP